MSVSLGESFSFSLPSNSTNLSFTYCKIEISNAFLTRVVRNGKYHVNAAEDENRENSIWICQKYFAGPPSSGHTCSNHQCWSFIYPVRNNTNHYLQVESRSVFTRGRFTTRLILTLAPKHAGRENHVIMLLKFNALSSTNNLSPLNHHSKILVPENQTRRRRKRVFAEQHREMNQHRSDVTIIPLSSLT